MSDYLYYEDPAFYAGINEGIFGMISGIMSLVQQGQQDGNYNPNYVQQQQEKDKTLYIGFGVVGLLILILIVVLVLKK